MAVAHREGKMSRTDDSMRRDVVFARVLRGHELVFHTTWGLFHPKGIDSGTALLIDRLELHPAQDSLDLGCGYGAIGLALAKCCPEGQVHLVDKDFVAIDYARKNVQVNGLRNCHVYLSNGFSHVKPRLFDNIVSNLPAKVGNELLTIMMQDAYRYLKPGGRFYVVTIAGLKPFIKRNFKALFGNYKKVKEGRAHTVAMAVRDN